MIIHVVQPRETIYSIASDYNVSVTNLVEQNGLINSEQLVVGQTIVIAYPEKVYVAQSDDTVDSITRAFGITRMQLLRNNPFLSDREDVYQGEEIIIRYQTQGSIAINAYTYPFIDLNVLRKTLPYLTYLTIFNYRINEAGEIVGSDETDIISVAKEYGVAPLMSVSTLTYQGLSDIRAISNFLYNEANAERNINTIIRILREKGYYGLNISLVNLNQGNKTAYEYYINKLSVRLKAEGYILFLTIVPRIVLTSSEVSFEQIDYTVLGQLADYVQILSYDWGSYAGPPSPTTPAYLTKMLLENAITMIPHEKLYNGISIIGYDWERPYILGITRANALTTDAAIELALQTNSNIKFEENAQAPYYEYNVLRDDTMIGHIVWFSDARSINSLIGFVPEFNILGVGIWNIMYFFTQMWLVINSQYQIIKLYPEQ